MASIVQKKNRYYVVYLYDSEDGRRKQKWESFKTKEEAKRRKAEIEYRQELGSLVIPKCKTVEELLREYVSLYGKNTWSMSMYEGSTGLIKNYINPIIGPMKLSEVTPRVLEKYYMSLLQTKAVIRCTDKQYTKRQTPGKRDSFVTPGTVRRVHKLLNSAFTQAMKWELIEKNPLLGTGFFFQNLREHAIFSYHNLMKAGVTESTILLFALCFGIPFAILFLAVIYKTLRKFPSYQQYAQELGLFVGLTLDLFWGGSIDNCMSLSILLLSMYQISRHAQV